MKKSLPIFLLIVLFLFSGNVNAQSVDLITTILNQDELPPHQLHHFKNAVRTRYFQIDFSKLNEQSEFNLMLFDGKIFKFKFKRSYAYKVGSMGWYGESIEGLGDIILSFYNGNIKGIVKDDDMKKYMLQQINLSDLFALTEVNVEGMQESPAGEPDYISLLPDPHKKSRVNADVCAAGTSCGSANIIDLMVLGNLDAIADAGGTVPAFITDVTSAVSEMNSAYTASGGLDLSFDLVYCDSFSFTTTASSSADLSSFRSNATVGTLRDANYADLVGLWVGAGSYASCGIGYINTDETDYSDLAAFTVTDYDCGMTNLTYAHECGHNMGLRHDYYVDISTTPCDHHHGYVNQAVLPSGLPVAGRWRTIMAYNDECSFYGFSCTRLARWSNPLLTYLGDATGRAIGMLDPADEIYGFARFRCVVSAFRLSPLPVQLISFTGEAGADFINLNWETANETNSRDFELEMRRSFSEEFTTLTKIPAKGNSSVLSRYNYLMQHPQNGTYYFRLKQTDIDHNFTYSEIVKVDFQASHFQFNLHPNPIENRLNLSFFNPEPQYLKVTLCDIAGRTIGKLFDGNCAKGYHEIQHETLMIQKGLYFCNVECGNEKSCIRFVVR